MRTIIQILVAVVLLSATNAFAYDKQNVASCVSFLEGTSCQLRWSFPQGHKSRFFAQQWDSESGEWRNLDKSPANESIGTRIQTVSEGRIYRFLGCDDVECESSNAVWAPDWTDPEDMPDYVEVKYPDEIIKGMIGKTKLNGEPHSSRLVIAQHNMYLVANEAAAFLSSDAEMPPMLRPNLRLGAPESMEETVSYNVYMEYEGLRAASIKSRIHE